LEARIRDLAGVPITESILLSVSGALLGLVIAYCSSRAFAHFSSTGLEPARLHPTLDFRVLVFAAIAAVITGLLIATVPFLYTLRIDPIGALRDRSRSVFRESFVVGNVLLISQIALSLVLVMGSMLLGRTIERLYAADPGYRKDHLLSAILFPQPGRNEAGNSPVYYQTLAEKVRAIPGVIQVSYSMDGPANENEFFRPVSRVAKGQPVQAISEFAGPEFFATVGMHVLSGRDFSWRDASQGMDVAVISQSLAARLYGRENPVGQTLYSGPVPYQDPLRVVGVVNSASLWKVESFQPMAVYQPIWQGPSDSTPMMDVHTAGDPMALAKAIEDATRSLGKQYCLEITTVEDRFNSHTRIQQVTALFAFFFAATSLLISAIALYGVVLFHVVSRTAELGVRIAVGARHTDLLWLVIQDVLLLAGAGCAIGLLVAEGAIQPLMKRILFGVSPTNPVVSAAAITTILAVSIAASLGPALRAAATDPVSALRKE
jgi:predicted permease